MENNRTIKINISMAALSALVLLIVFILAFQPIAVAGGGKKKMDIGHMAGYILSNTAKVDEDDEDELEEAIEDLEDYENLTLFSELQILIQYAKYSVDIYEYGISVFIVYFIFVTFVFAMKILFVVSVLVLLLRTIMDFIKKDCEISGICKRMCIVLGVWILPVMAGICFCEYCEGWGEQLDVEFGFAYSVIGILAILMCIICMLVNIVADRAFGKHLQSRFIALVLFFSAVFGIYSLKTDAFKITYSVENDDYEYLDWDGKYSFASLIEWEVLDTTSLIEEINDKAEDDASKHIGKLVNATLILAAGFGCIILLIIIYSISIGNFALGMCGKRKSFIKQIVCSLFGIAFMILLAILLKIGTNQIADIMETVYESGFHSDSVKCGFRIKYKMGYFIPFIVNIIFIVLSVVKKVFDQKLPVDNSYLQNMPYTMNYPQERVYEQTAYTSESYPQQMYLQNGSICPNCGAKNEQGYKFCLKCGQQIW